MSKIYQVHYPKTGRVNIKIDNVLKKYKHNEIVEEELFFVRYPNIFLPRPDLENKISEKNKFNIELVKKGWFKVLNESGEQVFPENNKSCRKIAATSFIKEQK